MRMRYLLFSLILFFLLSAAFAVPQKISFQGMLKDIAGTPVHGTRAVTFTIYNDVTGGTELWSEAHTITVEAGLYNVQLGETNPLTYSTFAGETRYLALSIGGVELSPRIVMVSVPFAFQAENSQRLGNYSVGTSGTNIVPRTDDTGLLSTSVIPGGGGGGGAGAQSVNLGPETIQSTAGATAVWVRGADVGGSFEVTNIGGIGVFARAPYNGIYGYATAADDEAAGVTGHALGTSGENYGVRGRSYSVSGAGGRFSGISTGLWGDSSGDNSMAVYGRNTGAGIGYGVFGRATTGYGVKGWAMNDGIGVCGQGTTAGGSFEASGVGSYGVYGKSTDSNGFGVYGYALSTTGKNYGVFGTSNSSSGYGVYGQATNGGGGIGVYGKGSTAGGSFEASAGGSYGVYGRGNYGVYGKSSSSTGTGVYGYVNGPADVNYGVYGETNSNVGYAGYFSGNKYGAFGRTTASDGSAVYGDAYNGGYGGNFNTQGGTGAIAVRAYANSTNGAAFYGFTESNSGYAAIFEGGRGIQLPYSTTQTAGTSEGTIRYNFDNKHFYGYVGGDVWKQLDN